MVWRKTENKKATMPSAILMTILMLVALTGCQSRAPADNTDISDWLGATSHWLDGQAVKPVDNAYQIFAGLREKSGFQMFHASIPLFDKLGILDSLGAADSAERNQTFRKILGMLGAIYSDPAYDELGFDTLEPVYQLSLPLLSHSTRVGYQVPFGHYYAFVPHDLDRSRPVDIALFLHGWGPNMAAWIARVVSGTHRSMIVIAPTSGGFGNWEDSENGLRAVLQMAQALHLGPYRLHAIGYSCGGAGVMDLALGHPGTFDSVLVIASAWMNFQHLRTHSLADGKTPFVFICGEQDSLTPYAVQATEALRSHGFSVDLSIEPGQDHFLFIDQGCERVNRALRELSTR